MSQELLPDKLYVLARRDLSIPQQGVQAGHALAQLVYRHFHDRRIKEWHEHYVTMIYLGVRDEEQLKQYALRLSDAQVVTELFVEPDMNNQATALAVMPGVDPELFKNLWLL